MFPVTICSELFDLDGIAILPSSTPVDVDAARRLSRTATLDGGCWITDQGATPSDETVTVSVTAPSPALLDRVRHIANTHATAIVTFPSGVYRAAIQRAQADTSALRVTLFIIARLSA